MEVGVRDGDTIGILAAENRKQFFGQQQSSQNFWQQLFWTVVRSAADWRKICFVIVTLQEWRWRAVHLEVTEENTQFFIIRTIGVYSGRNYVGALRRGLSVLYFRLKTADEGMPGENGDQMRLIWSAVHGSCGLYSVVLRCAMGALHFLLLSLLCSNNRSCGIPRRPAFFPPTRLLRKYVQKRAIYRNMPEAMHGITSQRRSEDEQWWLKLVFSLSGFLPAGSLYSRAICLEVS